MSFCEVCSLLVLQEYELVRARLEETGGLSREMIHPVSLELAARTVAKRLTDQQVETLLALAGKSWSTQGEERRRVVATILQRCYQLHSQGTL